MGVNLEMDFSNILKAEIASKKSSIGTSRFIKPSQKRKASPEPSPVDSQQFKSQKISTETDSMRKSDPEDEKVKKELRRLGEPITLFAETPEHRFERLQTIHQQTTSQESIPPPEALQPASDHTEHQRERRDKEEIQAEKDKLLESIDTSIISRELFEKNQTECERLVGVLFKQHLRTWERQILALPQTDEAQSKLAIYSQTRTNLKPFFKLLKTHTIDRDMSAHIVDICVEMQQREYLKANEAYLALSIGSAAWPIGVTSVGIHARSGREKISASKISHPLNNEATRKWVQGIKRVLTWRGEEYPPSDASKRA